ncbi:MAG: YgiT-type zinc finger protein, partial [Proteobacteria bacterium]|nr:YgiT-type zinc finger protein [Pseudomonadota bacterium]
IKGVPADICENCGEYYLSATVSEKVMAKAEAAVENGAEVEILRYVA